MYGKYSLAFFKFTLMKKSAWTSKKNIDKQSLISWIEPQYISGPFDPNKFERVKKGHYIKFIKPSDLDGDQPKDGVKIYKYGAHRRSTRKNKPGSWPLFLVKAAEKWYPSECITERFINRFGELIGMDIASSGLAILPSYSSSKGSVDQIRFLSEYFLGPGEQLIHGAQIIVGALDYEAGEVDRWERLKITRSHLTVSMVLASIKRMFSQNVESIQNAFQKLLLFDALIGNNDRHHYNWGVISNFDDHDILPRFSPIYDTARGLHWNSSDEEIMKVCNYPKEQYRQAIEKYCRNCRPKICWTQGMEVNHFELIQELFSSSQGLSSESISDFFDDIDVESVIEILKREFKGIIFAQRLNLVCDIIRYRIDKLRQCLKESNQQ